jgi:hypothetical protein
MTIPNEPGPVANVQPLRFDSPGLAGRRMRLLTDIPTDDAGVPQDLPAGITALRAPLRDETPSSPGDG